MGIMAVEYHVIFLPPYMICKLYSPCKIGTNDNVKYTYIHFF